LSLGDVERRGRESQRLVDLQDEAERISRERNIPFEDFGEFSEELRNRGLEAEAAIARAAQLAREQLPALLGLEGANNDDFWVGVRAAISEYEKAVRDATPQSLALARRASEIESQLSTVGVLTQGARDDLLRQRAAIQQQVVDSDERVRDARDASTREAEQASAATRGRELSRTDAQRAATGLAQGLEDIRQFFGRQAEDGNGLIDFQAAREAQLRFAEEQNRAAAPAIFSLADSVQNAILQGPSRAALNVSDISTQEGARELNRLLRGEDPARDNANLQELQRQSQILEENNRILREKLVAA
jgi:hypothetical protein